MTKAKAKTFWYSNHKLLYLYLAIRYRISPLRVCELAHATLDDEYSLKDEMVLDQLYDRGIITF